MRIALKLAVCICLAGCAGESSNSRPAKRPPPPAGAIINGPYLQSPGATVMTIMWETSTAVAGRLLYGTTPDYAYSFQEPQAVTMHEVRLSGLTAETRYYYQVTAGGTQSFACTGTFVTAPAATNPFTFAAFGDSRTDPVVLEAIAEKVAAAAPGFFIHVGDFVSNGADAELWRNNFFTPAAKLLHAVPLLPVVGNHEYPLPRYFAYFAPPAEESGSTTEAWYACDYGCAHVVVLDTKQDLGPTSPQHRWLISDLTSERAANAVWRILATHDPIYSSSLHGGNKLLQDILVPLCEAYRVCLVVSGHDHAYIRSVKNDVTYVVTGGAGATLYPVNQTPNPYQAYAASAYHYLIFTVSENRLSGEAYDIAGTPFDSFVIEPPAAK